MRFYINNVKYDNLKWEKQQKILPVGIKVLPLHPKIISNKLMTDTLKIGQTSHKLGVFYHQK